MTTKSSTVARAVRATDRLSPRWALALVALANLVAVALWPLPRAQAHPPEPRSLTRGVIVDDDFTAGSTAGVFSNAITPTTTSAGRTSALRVTIALVTSDSVVNLLVTKSGKTIVLPLNGGTALTSSTGVHTFTVGIGQAVASDASPPVLTPLTYNLSLSTSTRVGLLVVDEVLSDEM